MLPTSLDHGPPFVGLSLCKKCLEHGGMGRIQKCSNEVDEFFLLFQHMKNKLSKVDLERWAVTTWAIWNARIKFYFQQIQTHPRVILEGANGLLEEYQRLMVAHALV